MTEQQKQAVRDQLTGFEAQWQAYKRAVCRFLSADQAAAPSPSPEETAAEIGRHKAAIVKHLRSINARLKLRPSGISRRGFASMDTARRTLLAGQAGKRAHALGKAHRFTHEEAQHAGSIGGRGRKGKRYKRETAA